MILSSSSSSSNCHTAASNYHRLLANTLVFFGFALTFITAAGLATAQYLTSEPISCRAPTRSPSTTTTSAMYSSSPSSPSRHDFSSFDGNMPSNAPIRTTLSSSSSTTPASKSSYSSDVDNMEEKIQHEMIQLAIQTEKLRRVQEENDQLRRLIEMMKEG